MPFKVEVYNSETHDFRNYVIKKSYLSIGRESYNDIAIDNEFISRKHVLIKQNKKTVSLCDCQSRNGTFIDTFDKLIPVKEKKYVRLPVLVRLANDIRVLVSSEQTHNNDFGQTQLYNDQGRDSKFDDIGRLGKNKAILVLDQYESSKIANKDNILAFHQKQRLAEISRLVFYRYKATFFKNTGDGFVATFLYTKHALAAAHAVLSLLNKRNKKTHNPPIHIRIALHFGTVYDMDSGKKDIHGNDVNIAFRMESISPPSDTSLPKYDRILCSQQFYENLKISGYHNQSYPYQFLNCGPTRLKGIEKPIILYYVVKQILQRKTSFVN